MKKKLHSNIAMHKMRFRGFSCQFLARILFFFMIFFSQKAKKVIPFSKQIGGGTFITELLKTKFTLKKEEFLFQVL